MGLLRPSIEQIRDIAKLVRKKTDFVMLYNSKTGKTYYRHKPTAPKVPPSEGQVQCRKHLGDASHHAGVWLRANNATACPPAGTDDYRKLIEMYKQSNSSSLLNFAIERYNRYGKVI